MEQIFNREAKDVTSFLGLSPERAIEWQDIKTDLIRNKYAKDIEVGQEGERGEGVRVNVHINFYDILTDLYDRCEPQNPGEYICLGYFAQRVYDDLHEIDEIVREAAEVAPLMGYEVDDLTNTDGL